MTSIRISLTGGRCVYDAKGHAGNEKVCAALSMMSGAVAAWALENGKNIEHHEESGDVYVSFDATYEALTVMFFVQNGLKALERSYGDYVKLISG